MLVGLLGDNLLGFSLTLFLGLAPLSLGLNPLDLGFAQGGLGLHLFPGQSLVRVLGGMPLGLCLLLRIVAIRATVVSKIPTIKVKPATAGFRLAQRRVCSRSPCRRAGSARRLASGGGRRPAPGNRRSGSPGPWPAPSGRSSPGRAGVPGEAAAGRRLGVDRVEDHHLRRAAERRLAGQQLVEGHAQAVLVAGRRRPRRRARRPARAAM